MCVYLWIHRQIDHHPFIFCNKIDYVIIFFFLHFLYFSYGFSFTALFSVVTWNILCMFSSCCIAGCVCICNERRKICINFCVIFFFSFEVKIQRVKHKKRYRSSFLLLIKRRETTFEEEKKKWEQSEQYTLRKKRFFFSYFTIDHWHHRS